MDVWVPNLRLVRAKTTADSEKWSKRAVNKTRRTSFYASILMSQFTENFDKVGTGLQMALGVKPENLLVFAGFNGRFAKALQEQGYSVFFTDANSDWVAGARKSGLKSARAFSAFLNPHRTFDTWITYEGNEALDGTGGLLALMRCLAYAKLGLVYVKSSKNTDPGTPVANFRNVKKTYCSQMKTTRANTLIFINSRADLRQRRLLKKDLAVILDMNKRSRKVVKVNLSTAQRLNALFKNRENVKFLPRTTCRK